MTTHSKSSHRHTSHPHHPMHLKSVQTTVTTIHGPITVPIVAHDHADAHKTLQIIGTGGAGAGLQNTYLGTVLPKIRLSYYKALQKAEMEITARRVELGPKINDPAEYRVFVAWASNKRTSIARTYRIPSGAGAIIGGELRDNIKYGAGGRTIDNLVARNMKHGLSETEAYARVLTTVDKPNLAVTESVVKGARLLKGGGVVLFAGGLALTGYEIYRASPNDRPALIKKEVITTGGSMLATDLVVGVALMVGVTGIGLLAIGVVAGVAASYGAERLYYAHQHSQAVHDFTATGLGTVGAFSHSVPTHH